MQELKRVINYKKLILLTFVAVANIIFFIYSLLLSPDSGCLSDWREDTYYGANIKGLRFFLYFCLRIKQRKKWRSQH